MGVLRGFERRLEGAVEGMFARAFKAGLQPIEIAKEVVRYCEDHKQVTPHGVVVPNEFHLWLHPDDLERMLAHGQSLHRELAAVVRTTCRDNDWHVDGTTTFDFEADDDIIVGRFELRGRIQPDAEPAAQQRPAAAAPAPRPRADDTPPDWLRDDDPAPAAAAAVVPTAPPPAASDDPDEDAPTLQLEVLDTGDRHILRPGRHSIGRDDDCDVTIDATTVSRRHAIMLVRGERWWVFDLGSTNGTQVNNKRASELPVGAGDRVRIGTVELLVREA